MIAASVIVIGLCTAVLVERARIDRSNRRIDLGLSGVDEAAISVDDVAPAGRRTAYVANRASSAPSPLAPPIGPDPKENISRYPQRGVYFAGARLHSPVLDRRQGARSLQAGVHVEAAFHIGGV